MLHLCVVDLNPCQRNPCLNGGMCRIERGEFLCLCPPQYQGKTCDTGTQHLGYTGEQPWSRGTHLLLSKHLVNSCCTGKEHLKPCLLLFIFVSVLSAAALECRYKNGGCVQYCKDLLGGAGVQCGCADGYELESDGRSCTKTGDITALQSHCP